LASSYAQTDTLNYIPAVDIEGFKVREGSVGCLVFKMDTVNQTDFPHASVGEVLQRKSNVYVKTYGGNSLSTLSIRGASGSQNLVTWNGLPIQSSMLGLLDLSLIPSSFADEIALEFGGNSSSWGSGGNLYQGLSFQIGNKYFQSRTQIVYQKAKNDIVFRLADHLPKQRQENASFEQPALLQTFAARPNQYNNIEFHLWLQKSQKEIPPTLAQLWINISI